MSYYKLDTHIETLSGEIIYVCAIDQVKHRNKDHDVVVMQTDSEDGYNCVVTYLTEDRLWALVNTLMDAAEHFPKKEE